MQHLDEGTIHAWLDGALPAEEARQAEVHAAGCAACAEAVAEARGLIAASSMIISKLDGVLGAAGAPGGTGPAPADDIAAARAAADARQHPARRSWLAVPGVRAAAALLFLAGGVAAVQTLTGRDELARVVSDASPEAANISEAEIAPPAPEVAMQDATAASTEAAPVAPPPPTVGPAPVLPRPAQIVGGMTPRPAAPQGMVGDVSGVLRGVESAAARDEVSPTAASSANAVNGVSRAAVRVGSPPESQPADLAQERDRSAAAKVGAESAAPTSATAQAAPRSIPAAPPAPAAAEGAGAASLSRDLRSSDTTVARREARRLAEEVTVMEQRLVPQPDVRGRVAAAATAFADGADGAARCYVLTLSPWSPAQATIPGAPATRIALSADTGTVGPSRGNRLVRPLPGAFEGSYDHAWYTEVSPSTLVLTWATGNEGIVMRLVGSGATLTGTARTFGAAGGVERTSDVTGERVDCAGAR